MSPNLYRCAQLYIHARAHTHGVETGHLSRDCPVKKQQRQEKSKCWLCGKYVPPSSRSRPLSCAPHPAPSVPRALGSRARAHRPGHSRRECPGVDGEAWCSKNKGTSAPPKGDEPGHRCVTQARDAAGARGSGARLPLPARALGA